MIYSEKQDKFYAPEFQAAYEASQTWPADGVEISLEVWKEFSAVKEGKVRSFVNGQFVWVDHLVSKTVDQQSNEENAWRNAELTRADEELNKVQDSDPKAVGTVAGWREYRKALRAWPESVKFPNTADRPTSP